MGFTVKAKVTNIEAYNNGEQRVDFMANYVNAIGERVNQDWAQATPGFSNTLFVKDEVVERQQIQMGDEYTLTYTKD